MYEYDDEPDCDIPEMTLICYAFGRGQYRDKSYGRAGNRSGNRRNDTGTGRVVPE